MSKKWLILPIAVAALVLGAVAAFASTNSSSSTAMPNHAGMHGMTMNTTAAAKPSAADVRVTLDRLLGEHAQLAVAATRAGLNGSADFKAIAASLDANSVDLANTIGSLYGAKARDQFLNSKFGWRAHIGFFVDYTVATAKGDKAGQMKAVNNLKGYIGASANFFNGATGVPTKALVAGLTAHIMQLKGQVDAYHAKNYTKTAALTRASYEHMFMLGDALAAGIAKNFPQKLA